MRSELYRAARQVAYWSWNLLGVNAIFRRRNRDKIRIFTLHGVGDFEGKHDWLPLRQQLDVRDLRRALKILTPHYHFISMDDAAAIVAGKLAPIDNAAVLTFDDGYLNNFTQALPVLREFGVPGVFYIATGLIESRRPFWFDRLDYVLQIASAQGVTADVAGKSFRFETIDRKEIASEYSKLRCHCKKHFSDDQEFTAAMRELALDLEQQTGTSLGVVLEGDPWACVATTQDVQKYSSDELVTFGGHSISHMRLGLSTPERIEEELTVSKRHIEDWTGKPCVHFAYPNGDFNEAAANAVQEAGYVSAVTSEFGFCEAGEDIYTLQRQNIVVDFRNSELKARASGLEEAMMSLASRVRGLFTRPEAAPVMAKRSSAK